MNNKNEDNIGVQIADIGGKIEKQYKKSAQEKKLLDIAAQLKKIGEKIEQIIMNEKSASLRDFELDNEKLLLQAMEIIREEQKASISYIQRKLRIGYNRAANLIERMEKEGFLSPPDSSGKRQING